MDLSAIITLSLAILVLAWKPGAGFFLTMFITLRQGPKAALIFVFGAAIGDAIYFVIASYGIAASSELMDFLVILVKSLGATYLIWYGLKGLGQKYKDIGGQEIPTANKPVEDFFTGILFTLGNPLAIIFYMALLPSILDLKTLTNMDIALAALVVVIAGTFSYITLIATAYFLGKPFVKNEKFMNGLNIATSIAIIGIGLLIGWSAFPIIDFQEIFF